MFIPQAILRKLYTKGSMRWQNGALHFELKNRLKAASLNSVKRVALNGEVMPLQQVLLMHTHQTSVDAFNRDNASAPLPLGAAMTFSVPVDAIRPQESVHVLIELELEPFGTISVQVEDSIREAEQDNASIPRDPYNNLSTDIIQQRQEYVRAVCGSDAPVLFDYRGPTAPFTGNIENFIGTAQIPVGLAGPIQVNGKHAQGLFHVPLATTEGTLVASYSRGMKAITQSGGARVTVFESVMQRAPVFVFDNASDAYDFWQWLMMPEQLQAIKMQAEATDPFVKFMYLDPYTANKFVFVRFNFETGDAAGQNMTGQATYAACNWILSQYPKVANFYLEANMATDKKASQINTMHTRGKRVTAEVTLTKAVLEDVMHVDPEQIDYHARVAAIGSFLAGVNNNGLHAANGLAAIFIATGQDAANIAESSAGILYSELTEDGGLYLSLTLPALIIATYGGGTGLPTQQECLKMMRCTGKGSALKLAEIIAATALAGEVSLASAISSLDWVSSHEQYGRNR